MRASVHPSSRPSIPPRRCMLRELLDICLPLSADLDAFCSDHLPRTYRRFTCGLDRIQKITLMLEHAGAHAVEAALWLAFPSECAAHVAAWEQQEPAPITLTAGLACEGLHAAAELQSPSPAGTALRWARHAGYAVALLGGFYAAQLLTERSRSLRPVTSDPVPPSSAVPATPPPDPEPGMRCFPGGTIRQHTESGWGSVHVLPFCLDVQLVTAREYLDCFGSGACRPSQGTNYSADADKASQGVLDELCTAKQEPTAKQPMNCVNWHEAARYCEAQGKRLPSSAEWEIAAGALENQLYPWGSSPPTEDKVNGCDARCVDWAAKRNMIWKRGQGTRVLLEPADGSVSDRLLLGDDGYAATSPIDAKPPSVPYGLYDLSGNLRQWTQDTPTDCTDPDCPVLYILKGGSWGDVQPEVFNRHTRTKAVPSLRSELNGFRCAKRSSLSANNRHIGSAGQYRNPNRMQPRSFL